MTKYLVTPERALTDSWLTGHVANKDQRIAVMAARMVLSGFSEAQVRGISQKLEIAFANKVQGSKRLTAPRTMDQAEMGEIVEFVVANAPRQPKAVLLRSLAVLVLRSAARALVNDTLYVCSYLAYVQTAEASNTQRLIEMYTPYVNAAVGSKRGRKKAAHTRYGIPQAQAEERAEFQKDVDWFCKDNPAQSFRRICEQVALANGVSRSTVYLHTIDRRPKPAITSAATPARKIKK